LLRCMAWLARGDKIAIFHGWLLQLREHVCDSQYAWLQTWLLFLCWHRIKVLT
jgi:hypothetical protein